MPSAPAARYASAALARRAFGRVRRRLGEHAGRRFAQRGEQAVEQAVGLQPRIGDHERARHAQPLQHLRQLRQRAEIERALGEVIHLGHGRAPCGSIAPRARFVATHPAKR